MTLLFWHTMTTGPKVLSDNCGRSIQKIKVPMARNICLQEKG